VPVATPPTILVLDFDGVLCDGMREYFRAAWTAYCQIWHSQTRTPPDDLEGSFARVRPAIEIGWEMPVAIHSLLEGVSEEKILQNGQVLARDVLDKEGLDPAEIGAWVDSVRDDWIASDLPGWLEMHRFYPGVVERLTRTIAAGVGVTIATTKEGRFVRHLLQQQGIFLPENAIFGKEYHRPKHETLRQLLANADSEAVLWFVEDRLKTLQSIQQQPDLGAVKLYLADWGYNTETEREAARSDSGIKLISLSQFGLDFAQWP